MTYYDFDLQGCLNPQAEHDRIIQYLVEICPGFAYYRESSSRNGNLHAVTQSPDPHLAQYQDPHFQGYVFFNNKGSKWAEGLWHNVQTGDKEDDLFLMPTICLCLYQTYEIRHRIDSEDYGDQEICHELLFTDKWDRATFHEIDSSNKLRFCFVSLIRLVPENVWPFRTWRPVSSQFDPDQWCFSPWDYGICLEDVNDAYARFVQSIPPDHNPANHVDQLLKQNKYSKITVPKTPFSIIL